MVKYNDFYPVPYKQISDNTYLIKRLREYSDVILEPTSGIGSIIAPIKDALPNKKIYSNELSKQLLKI
jgi:hypothetical protein